VPRIFFATDLHGSDLCFRKFLKAPEFYGADILFLGGDYSHKELIMYAEKSGGIDVLSGFGKRSEFRSKSEFDRYLSWCSASGRLVERVDQRVMQDLDSATYNELFDRKLKESITRWIDAAEASFRRNSVPIYVIPGNDDPPFTDDFFSRPPFLFVHRHQVSVGREITLLGWGGSNRTPWHTVRESEESDIERELNAALGVPMNGTSILFVHPPPFQSGLDLAPALGATYTYNLSFGSPDFLPVGSVAVRQFVERQQPLLGLFGHVHEGRGHQKIGRTLCVNPGSAFQSGRLQGCLLTIDGGRVVDFQFTEG
jgi:Icc-related predicted phosphoesterase